MQHKFSVITIEVYGFCEKCKKLVSGKQLISISETQHANPNGEVIRSLKLQKAYEEFENHECTI